MKKASELQYFEGNNSLMARDSRTHIKFGEKVSLTLQEIEAVNQFVLSTTYTWSLDVYNKHFYRVVREKFNLVNGVVEDVFNV